MYNNHNLDSLLPFYGMSFTLSPLTELDFWPTVYDQTAIKCNEMEANTNFELSTYERELSSEVDNGGIILCFVLIMFNGIYFSSVFGCHS